MNIKTEKISYRPHYLTLLLTLNLALFVWGSEVRANEHFEILKAAKKIVFLGDSITYGGEYIVFFERWLTVNHPELTPTVLNQGIPSETVSGLSEPGHLGYGFPRPDLHERLERTLTTLKPDLVIACYGINCGIYQPLDEVRFDKYRKGITRLKEAVEKHKARIIFMTPPVYDKPNKAFNYDDVMTAYSTWLVSRPKAQWMVIDLHTEMKKRLDQKREKDPTFKYSRDGVHPGSEGHELMAQGIIDFFAVKPPLENPHPNSYGRMMMYLRKRMRVMGDAWLTEIGHTRPKMRKGMPLDEAKKIADDNTKQILQNLKNILNHQTHLKD